MPRKPKLDRPLLTDNRTKSFKELDTKTEDKFQSNLAKRHLERAKDYQNKPINFDSGEFELPIQKDIGNKSRVLYLIGQLLMLIATSLSMAFFINEFARNFASGQGQNILIAMIAKVSVLLIALFFITMMIGIIACSIMLMTGKKIKTINLWNKLNIGIDIAAFAFAIGISIWMLNADQTVVGAIILVFAIISFVIISWSSFVLRNHIRIFKRNLEADVSRMVLL